MIGKISSSRKKLNASMMVVVVVVWWCRQQGREDMDRSTFLQDTQASTLSDQKVFDVCVCQPVTFHGQ